MEPKTMRFRTIEGRRPVIDDEERQRLQLEGQEIRNADQRDGTNAFLEASFSDVAGDEPDYEW